MLQITKMQHFGMIQAIYGNEMNDIHPRIFVADMPIQKFLRYGRNFCDIDFNFLIFDVPYHKWKNDECKVDPELYCGYSDL